MITNTEIVKSPLKVSQSAGDRNANDSLLPENSPFRSTVASQSVQLLPRLQHGFNLFRSKSSSLQSQDSLLSLNPLSSVGTLSKISEIHDKNEESEGSKHSKSSVEAEVSSKSENLVEDKKSSSEDKTSSSEDELSSFEDESSSMFSSELESETLITRLLKQMNNWSIKYAWKHLLETGQNPSAKQVLRYAIITEKHFLIRVKYFEFDPSSSFSDFSDLFTNPSLLIDCDQIQREFEESRQFVFLNIFDSFLLSDREFIGDDNFFYFHQAVKFIQFKFPHVFSSSMSFLRAVNNLETHLPIVESPIYRLFEKPYLSQIFHHRTLHLVASIINFILFVNIIYWFVIKGYFSWFLTAYLLLITFLGFVLNISWFLYLKNHSTANAMDFLQSVISPAFGRLLIFVFDIITIPIIQSLFSLLFKADPPCPPGQYDTFSKYGSTFYDFILNHDSVCVPCAQTNVGNHSSDLCFDLCNGVKRLKSDPFLRYNRDVIQTSIGSIIFSFVYVFAALPYFWFKLIQFNLERAKNTPVYGKDVETKWRNLMGRIDSLFWCLFSSYKYKFRYYWIYSTLSKWLYTFFSQFASFSIAFQYIVVILALTDFLFLVIGRIYISSMNLIFALCTSFFTLFISVFPIVETFHVEISGPYVFVPLCICIALPLIMGITLYCIATKRPEFEPSDPTFYTAIEKNFFSFYPNRTSIPDPSNDCTKEVSEFMLCDHNYLVSQLPSGLKDASEDASRMVSFKFSDSCNSFRHIYDLLYASCASKSYSYLLRIMMVIVTVGIVFSSWYIGSVHGRNLERFSLSC